MIRAPPRLPRPLPDQTKLPNSTTAWDDLAHVGRCDQPGLEQTVAFVIEYLLQACRKNRSLDDQHA